MSFPFHPDAQGVAARCIVPPHPPGASAEVSLTEQGRVTSHKVKFTHWADGSAHFSHDGKVRTEVRNVSVPLDSQTQLFSIYVQGLANFSALDIDKEYYSGKYGRAGFDLIEGEPSALRFVGRWSPIPAGRRPEELKARMVVSTPNERQEEHLAIGPPPGSPLEGYVLLLNVYMQDVLVSDEWFLLFTGGFSPGFQDSSTEGSFLALKYSSLDLDIPTIDLP